jgi:hypothetical protein
MRSESLTKPQKFTRPLLVFLVITVITSAFTNQKETGEWEQIFNGRDFTGWIVPEGDNGHWRVVDGVIDYDARSQAPGDKNLWTRQEYGDFVLKIDWRITDTPWTHPGCL